MSAPAQAAPSRSIPAPGSPGSRDGAEANPQNARSDSYYGMSVLNPPVWEEREIAGYLFLGGLAGGSSLLAALADDTGRPTLARRAQLGASGAIALSLAALIKDLGRPARFLNMLRVVKPTSPMNIGTWILVAYSPLNFAATASGLSGRLPRAGRVAGAGAGVLGSLVVSYTGALIADTAVPAWHDGHRELPFLFAGSAAMAAGGLGLVAAPLRENSPAWRLALLGAVSEVVLHRAYEQRLGPVVSETLHSGTAGPRLKLAKGLAIGGMAVAAVGGRRSRAAAAASGVSLLAASAFTRFGIFAAGMTSARDPRYTVQPQRERLARP